MKKPAKVLATIGLAAALFAGAAGHTDAVRGGVKPVIGSICHFDAELGTYNLFTGPTNSAHFNPAKHELDLAPVAAEDGTLSCDFPVEEPTV